MTHKSNWLWRSANRVPAWAKGHTNERADSLPRVAGGPDMTSGAWVRLRGMAAGFLGDTSSADPQGRKASAPNLLSLNVLAWLATGTVAAVGLATVFDGLRLALGQESNPDLERGGYFLLGLGAILLALCLYAVLVRKPLTPKTTEATPEATTADPEAIVAASDEDQPQVRLVAICLALIVAFIVLLPWVGFAVANAIFLVGYLRAISKYRWITAIVAGCAIDAVFVALFAASRVPMPTGVILI